MRIQDRFMDQREGLPGRRPPLFRIPGGIRGRLPGGPRGRGERRQNRQRNLGILQQPIPEHQDPPQDQPLSPNRNAPPREPGRPWSPEANRGRLADIEDHDEV